MAELGSTVKGAVNTPKIMVAGMTRDRKIAWVSIFIMLSLFTTYGILEVFFEHA